MKRALSAAWRPRLPLTFQELDSNMFLVQFGHDVDLKRVLEEGPWSFERNIVVLKSIENDEQPNETEMTKVPFSIRIINPPLSKRNESSVRRIAAKIGDVVEVDNTFLTNGSKHIRVKVIINIMNPLCRFVPVLNFHNTKVRVHIQYEGLGFVARDHNGEVLFSGARVECYASSPLEAEAKAIHWAMINALGKGYSRVIFETDSLCLIKALQNKVMMLEIASLFSDILSHSLAFDVCTWSFVKREGNMAAHTTASLGLTCFNGITLDNSVPSDVNVWIIRDKDVLLSNME